MIVKVDSLNVKNSSCWINLRWEIQMLGMQETHVLGKEVTRK